MKQFNGYKAEESKSGEQLPVGGYVCKIISAEVKTYASSQGGTFERLEITFDIEEGNYSGFYAQQLATSQYADAKYKGIYRIAVPDESSQYADSQKRTFNNLMWSVEESNPNYHWNWNEKALAGKLLGIIFRNEEWSYKGKTGWSVRPYKATSAEAIRAGAFKVPADKALKKDDTAGGATESFETIKEEDLPFD